jgi:hypothetical protein
MAEIFTPGTQHVYSGERVNLLQTDAHDIRTDRAFEHEHAVFHSRLGGDRIGSRRRHLAAAFYGFRLLVPENITHQIHSDFSRLSVFFN